MAAVVAYAVGTPAVAAVLLVLGLAPLPAVLLATHRSSTALVRPLIAVWSVGAPLLCLLEPAWAALWPMGPLLALAYLGRADGARVAGVGGGLTLFALGLRAVLIGPEAFLAGLPGALGGLLGFALAHIASTHRTMVVEDFRQRVWRRDCWLHPLATTVIELDPEGRVVDEFGLDRLPSTRPEAARGRLLAEVCPSLAEALSRISASREGPTPIRLDGGASLVARRSPAADGGVTVALMPTTAPITTDLADPSQSQVLQAGRLAHMGVLANGVAHEINTPLAYLMTNLQYIQSMMDEPDPELGEALADAVEGARRIQAIVRDMETFSQSDDSDLLELVPPADVIQAAVRPLRAELERKAEFRVQHSPAPHVLANPARLSQAVLNLLSNAVQAIPEGRPTPGHIELVTGEIPGTGEAYIEVRDDGVGIAAHELRRVFEPFFTTRPVGKGTGLGLSIAYGLVKRLGGEIDVSSTVGRGSTFRIRLPDGGTLRSIERRAAPLPEPLLAD